MTDHSSDKYNKTEVDVYDISENKSARVHS